MQIITHPLPPAFSAPANQEAKAPQPGNTLGHECVEVAVIVATSGCPAGA